MKYIFITLCMFFILTSIDTKNTLSKIQKPNSVIIYSLSLYTRYLIDVNCDDVEFKDDVKKYEFVSKNKINKIYKLLKDTTNLTEVKNINSIDARIKIVFKKNKNIIDEYCLSLHYLKHGNKYYKHDSQIINGIFKEINTGHSTQTPTPQLAPKTPPTKTP